MSHEEMQLGHYQLLRLLGSSDGNAMYLAEDMRIQRQVLITLVQTEATPSLQTEIRAIAMLDHPHILPLSDFGTESVNGITFTYLVMPFRSECSLTDWLQQRNPSEMLSLEAIGHLLYQAADALQYAHEHQLIHQDIHPSNFLIRSRKEYLSRPDLLVTGFRITKFTPATASSNENIHGTPAYIAPEQWDSQPVPASDQYALAVLVYQLLVGHPPFQGTPEEVRHDHFSVKPQPLSLLHLHVSPALDAVILRALAKNPEDRFPSILAFAEAFQQVILDEPEERQQTLPARAFDKTQPIGPTSAPLPPPIITHTDGTSRGLPGKGVILLVGLIILLLVGSTGLFLMRMINHGALSNAAAAQSNTLAKDIRATVTAQANATATTIALSYPFSNTLLLNDPLSDDSQGNQWEQDSDGLGNCTFQEGTYHVSISQQGRFHTCIARASHFSSFTYEVQMTIIKGDCGGLIFRRSGPKFYYFRICIDGSYALIRYAVDALSPRNVLLQSGTGSAFKIVLNVTNLVAVVARGSKLDFYIDRHLIVSVSDTSYIQGQVGLLAKDEMHPTEVVFTNAKVWAF
jgi:eukaryotic-like serine/threonine-protein kinase